MEIYFSKIIPLPLPESFINTSQIWNREFIISPKEKVLICAESGKGKTTFINILFGLRKDYHGNLIIDNTDIKNYDPIELSDLRKQRLSIVPQGLLLFDELTVLENIEIKNSIGNFFSRDQILNILTDFDIIHHKDKKAGILSYGQKQRLAITRALCQRFDFILLDEPFSHLDDKNKSNALKILLKHVEEQNAGLIITSLHDNIDFEFTKKLTV